MSDVSARRIGGESYLRVRADSRIEVIRIQRDGLVQALTTDYDFEQAGLKAMMLLHAVIFRMFAHTLPIVAQ
jgi:hypothetical protein